MDLYWRDVVYVSAFLEKHFTQLLGDIRCLPVIYSHIVISSPLW